MFKKYRIRCAYCGFEEYKWEWLLKLKLIFKDHYYYNCEKCHKINCYRFFFHLKHDSTDALEKNRNKQRLFDNRMW